MVREVLSGPKLYAVLYRAFEEARPKDCVSCRMPLPVLNAGYDVDAANWHIGEVHRCARGCDVVIAQVAAAAAERYDISWPHIQYGIS
jgi:hypothetical protein